MKKWIENNGCHELHFTPFYDDIILLKFCQDETDPTCWWYVSETLNVEDDCIWEDSLEEAKETFEAMIVTHYNEQSCYYEDLLNKFQGEE